MMSFLHSFNIHHRNASSIEKNQDHQNQSETLFGVQKWLYYRDLIIESDHSSISSELSSFRSTRLCRSLYNLIYTPNDELDYFLLYMESCRTLCYIKFIFDINRFEKILRENSNNDEQTIALTLYHRYLSVDAEYLVPINDNIRRTTLSLICPSNDSTKPDSDCFRMAKEYIWHLIEQKVYPDYLQGIYHTNYQFKILTSNQLELHDILHDSTSLSYFVQFAEQKKITNLVQFWIDVDRFHQNVTNTDINNNILEEVALNVYEKYISLQAPLRLGFDDAIRAKIECSICQPDRNAGPSIHTFDQTAWIVYMILQREYFPKFLQSIIFYRYINDLTLKIHHKESVQQTTTSKLDMNSIDRENLVEPTSSDSSHQQRNIGKVSSHVNDMTSHPQGRLSMGYIDPLGRFIRDPDLELDSIDCKSPSSNRKSYSKPFQFLKQFVRNEHNDIVTEQVAARFAETFINEITNRTQNFDSN